MPPDIEQVLDQLREVLIRWQRQKKRGEVAIVCGPNDFEVQERPMVKLPRVRREASGSSILEKVTEP